MRRLQGIAHRAALSGYKEATMGKRGEKRERRSAILERAIEYRRIIPKIIVELKKDGT
jgi:hypothetical protein